MNWLRDASREATGANDVAVGKVDVSVAESGTALLSATDPLLSRVDYYDLEATDELANVGTTSARAGSRPTSPPLPLRHG